MSRRIAFTVAGTLPPKKDGASSMWGKSSEIDRLIALRRAAAAAARDGPLETGIRLELTITCAAAELARVGDLDNFITGVCDGLMACSARAALGEDWNRPELSEIHPRRPLAILDDRHVVEIAARKVASSDGAVGYSVTLVGR